MINGIVLKGVGGLYTVRLDTEYEGSSIITVRGRGSFRHDKLVLLTGDRVSIEPQSDGSFFCKSILERKNSLIRPPLANLDIIFVVIPCKKPMPSFEIIDKLIAIAEHNKIEPVILVTKADLDKEFAAVRAGRANPAVLDKVMVDYYGAPTPVNQMAAISVSEARILVIQPWDKSSLKLIEKAIQASDIGINPTNDGNVLRLAFPQLTEERRKELCKSIKKYGEDCKVAVRSIRRDTMDKLKAMKKNSEITEDDLKDCEKKVQDLTDKFCADADKAVAAKEKEIMTV